VTVLLPPGLPQVNPIRVDYFVLGFALLLLLFASAGFGLVRRYSRPIPIWQASFGREARGGSEKSRRAHSSSPPRKWRSAMVLLVAAGLLLRSFNNCSTSSGFNVNKCEGGDFLAALQYSTSAAVIGFATNGCRIHAEPGLQQAAVTVPPRWPTAHHLGFDVPARRVNRRRKPHANYVSVSRNTFA